MKNFKQLLLVLLVTTMLFSCKQEDPKTIEISTKNKEVNYTATNGEIGITSNTNWQAKSNEDWLKIVSVTTEKVSYECLQNNTAMERNADIEVTIEDGGLDNFNLKQKKHPIYNNTWKLNDDSGWVQINFSKTDNTGTDKHYNVPNSNFDYEETFTYIISGSELTINGDGYTSIFEYSFSADQKEMTLKFDDDGEILTTVWDVLY